MWIVSAVYVSLTSSGNTQYAHIYVYFKHFHSEQQQDETSLSENPQEYKCFGKSKATEF